MSRMTSNVRYRKSLRPSLSPLMTKSSFRGKQSKLDDTFLKKLYISPKTIKFATKGTHNQYVYNKYLKLDNKTGYRIAFKIKSNNPQNYYVTPCSGRLYINESVDIRIRLYIQALNIRKYMVDKFCVEWGQYETACQPQYTEKMELKVEVTTDIDAYKVKTISKVVENSQKDIYFYYSLIHKNKHIISKLYKYIRIRYDAPKPWVISYGMGAFLALLAFIVGYFVF